MPSPTAGPTDAGTCPPDSDLTAFLDEALPADRQAALGDHIDRCPGCQARLDALARDPSGTVDRYRRLTSTPPHTFLPLPLPPPDPAKTRIINGPAVPANVTFDALTKVESGYDYIYIMNGSGVSEMRCSQTCSMPAAVRNSVMNTIDTAISQNDHISTTCALPGLHSRPRSSGML